MIEREEYCVDILQQTAALRAAVDSVGDPDPRGPRPGLRPDRRRAGRGRRLRRRGRRRRPPDARPTGPQRRSPRLIRYQRAGREDRSGDTFGCCVHATIGTMTDRPPMRLPVVAPDRARRRSSWSAGSPATGDRPGRPGGDQRCSPGRSTSSSPTFRPRTDWPACSASSPETVGARRAAVLSTGTPRRIAVSAGEHEPTDAATALAAWLDAEAPRSRADRAASGPASVAIVVQRDSLGGAAAIHPLSRRSHPLRQHRDPQQRPASSSASSSPSAAGPAAVDDRLPARLARHAAVALALVTDQLAVERELAELRAARPERASATSRPSPTTCGRRSPAWPATSS